MKKKSDMKKPLTKLMIICCSLLCCTACFDIQENLFLKKDGSGNFSFLIEMGEFKSMAAMFDNVGSVFDNKDQRNEKQKKEKEKKKSPNEKLSSTFEITRRKLLNTNGISNVKAIEDTASVTFGISFDFKNITALNIAMNKLFEDDSATTTENITYFEYKDNELRRLEALDSKSILGKSSSLSSGGTDKNSGSLGMDVEKLFATVTYTTNYEFEEKITSTQNQDALLAANMKKVTMKLYPFAAVKDSTKPKPTIANIISFK